MEGGERGKVVSKTCPWWASEWSVSNDTVRAAADVRQIGGSFRAGGPEAGRNVKGGRPPITGSAAAGRLSVGRAKGSLRRPAG